MDEIKFFTQPKPIVRLHVDQRSRQSRENVTPVISTLEVGIVNCYSVTEATEVHSNKRCSRIFRECRERRLIARNDDDLHCFPKRSM